MVDVDPFGTQRDASGLPAELVSAGFDNAEEIGRGGFGVVYRCTQTSLDRSVAVKVLTSDLDAENRERFFREERAMGLLTGHPNIVDALQVGVTDSGRPYIVMQYHPHGSLNARIQRHGPLSLEDALTLGVKLAGALETAHRIGILHRDVKPSNILLTEYGEPKLTDFGIAHITGAFETATGIVTGSPAFTAPEVLNGSSPSVASDVYGLGATLFSALTGHAAFERRSGEQLVTLFVRITTQSIPDLREQGLAPDITSIVERAMAAQPSDRQPTAAALGEELREAQLHHGLPTDQMALHAEPDKRNGLFSGYRSLESRGRRLSRPHPRKGVKGNLPVELTSFVGRRHELTEIKEMLATSHLVTLIGPGGVGKTRLSLRAATTVKRNFTDGVWLVELGELQNESSLMDLLAASLDVRDQSGRSLREVLLEHLTPLDLLLVLDNCEQLIAAVADLSEELLQTCPRLRILATSREPLGIGGEITLTVPPLTTPDPETQCTLEGLPLYDAVTLFRARAAAVVPSFTLSEDNKVAVARICHRLDGLPLSIELAAARIRVMSPEQILQRLDDRYTLLTRGRRGAPNRQQTLRLCIDWSYELCTPSEQLVWSRLSVFAGSFELDAAEQICGADFPPGTLLDLVTSLVDKSILIREGQNSAVRFRLLETLRAYGREIAQRSAEYPQLSFRHRDWYQQLALDAEADWISSHQLAWAARLERELPNLREALEFCASTAPDSGLRIAAALLPFWNSQGFLDEGRRWLDRFLAKQPELAGVDRMKATYASSLLAELQGDLTRANELVEEGLTVAEQTTVPLVRVLGTYMDGVYALFNGDLTRACSCLEDSVHVFRESDNLTLLVEALTTLGLAYDWLDDASRATSCYEEVLTITEPRGELWFRSFALWAMGVAMWRRGDHGHAAVRLSEAILLSKELNDSVGVAISLEALGWVAASTRNAHRAVTLMAAAETISRDTGSSSVYFPNTRAYHDQVERMTRQELGQKSFESARRKGNLMNIDSAVALALNENAPAASPTRKPSVLTTREQQVAELVAQGLTNRTIATELVISQRTAQGHVEHILAKLGFSSRSQVAAWIVEQRRDS